MILRCLSAKDLIAMSKVALDFEQLVCLVIIPKRLRIDLKSRRLDLSFSSLETAEYTLVMMVVIYTGSISHLNLSECDLTRVSPEVLAKAVSNVSSANLYKTKLLNIQVVKILKHSLKSSKLTRLNMGKVESFDSVTPLLLKEAVRRLKVAEFSASSLSVQQVKGLFSFYNESTTLEELDLSYIDLTHISVSDLDRTAGTLKKISLWGNNNLREDQFVRLLKTAGSKDRTLKEIQISRQQKLKAGFVSSRGGRENISAQITFNHGVVNIV